MPPPHAAHSPLRLGPLAAAAAVVLLAAGCDNPFCVFGTDGCNGPGGTPGGLGTESASQPSGEELVRPGSPTIASLLPGSSGFVHSRTPIALVFSESLSPASVAGAFGVQRLDVGGFPGPLLVLSSALVADGRVLLLLPPPAPAPALVAGDYQIVISPAASPADITGQPLDAVAGPLGIFSVDTENAEDPELLLALPADEDSSVSAVGELVLVFDRPMVEADFLDGGFAVEIDDAPPAFPSPPRPLLVQTGTPPFVFSLPDTRVWLWSALDAAGQRLPLPAGAVVEVSLSPTTAPLGAVGGGELAPEILTFDVAEFSAPSGLALLSEPAGAIGIENLTTGGASPLAVGALLSGAQAGDDVSLYVFGNGLSDASVLVAVLRTLELPAAGPLDSVTFTLDELDLVETTAPLQAIFSDGELALAMNVTRDGVESPLAVLDVADDESGLQHALLDTLRPELLELYGAAEGSFDFRSTQRDLALAGRASEELARVEVRVPSLLLDNGAGDVVASGAVPAADPEAGSVFLAAPVPVGRLGGVDLLGALPPVVGYEATLVDRAGNAAAADLTGLFTQLGNVGPDALAADGAVHVRVFDAVTRLPVSGARVIAHADQGNAVDYPFTDAADTDPNGLAEVHGHSAGQAGTIVTVSHPDYDLFTFERVPSNRLDVPLAPTGAALAEVSGTVAASTAAGQVALGGLTSRVSDSRRVDELITRTVPCVGFPFVPTCGYGALPIHAGEPGALGFVAGTLTVTSPDQANGGALVRAFGLSLPAPPADAGDEQALGLVLGPFLTEDGVPPEDLPVDLPEILLDATASGLLLDELVDEPTFTGEPYVSVEANVPGLSGTALVGIGLGFARTVQGVWDVRAAHPGVVGASGRLATQGTIDPDLLVRLEVADLQGGVAGARPRKSTLAAATEPVLVVTAAVPEILAPPDLGAAGALPFDVQLGNSLSAAILDPGTDYGGLLRVTLLDATGRAWTVWRVADTSGVVRLHLPDVASAPALGTPLAPGPWAAAGAAFAWQGFDPLDFTWTDVGREHDLFALGHPVAFTVP